MLLFQNSFHPKDPTRRNQKNRDFGQQPCFAPSFFQWSTCGAKNIWFETESSGDLMDRSKAWWSSRGKPAAYCIKTTSEVLYASQTCHGVLQGNGIPSLWWGRLSLVAPNHKMTQGLCLLAGYDGYVWGPHLCKSVMTKDEL